jgi:membrane fusion protein (multidrug efflux system)
MAMLAVAACADKSALQPASGVEVTAVTAQARDIPAVFEFVGRTESSRHVEIRTRVSGFLDAISYREGSRVDAGQVLFQIDPKPFQVQLQAAEAELALQQARLVTARAALARVRPLAEENALSQKELDDAVGQDKAAAASVESAQARIEAARLDLGYATIRSPVTGQSSYATKAEGSYVGAGPDSLLTTVAALDPMWVDFSVSEQQWLGYQGNVKSGRLRPPVDENYEVEIALADGSVYEETARITFADANLSPETATLLVRATVANPKGVLLPGQFVRARLNGAVWAGAVSVPQRAIMQGAQGSFVWIIAEDGTARPAPVELGPLQGDDWILFGGLKPGDRFVVDGAIRVRPGVPLTVAEPPAPAAAAAEKAAAAARD